MHLLDLGNEPGRWVTGKRSGSFWMPTVLLGHHGDARLGVGNISILATGMVGHGNGPL